MSVKLEVLLAQSAEQLAEAGYTSDAISDSLENFRLRGAETRVEASTRGEVVAVIPPAQTAYRTSSSGPIAGYNITSQIGIYPAGEAPVVMTVIDD